MKCWGYLGLVGVMGVGGTIIATSAAIGQAVPSNIVPDATLGAESSQVQTAPGLPVEVIRGGAVRGINLFHSFQEFNISQGRGAYFSSPDAAIQNILARVTGSNPSQILGTLGTFGSSQPSLFLINPNGIVFGPNASLDVGGSFVATTANAVLLGDTGRFSASDPPSSTLLTVNPSALFFNAINSQAGIVNQSRATSTVLGNPVNGDLNRPIFGLQVLQNQNLLLVGGNVSLDSGVLQAPSGRVELGGLASAGTVELDADGSLAFPDGVTRADVFLTNEARVNVASGGGGNIAINAQNLGISGRSSLIAGIEPGSGTPDAQAGNIILNATEAINLDAGFVFNQLQAGGIGNAGGVNVTANSLGVTNGATLTASTFGQGDAGDIVVQATTVILDGVGNNGFSSVVGSTVEQGASGNGGNVLLTAGTLSVSNGAALNASTFGQGVAGNVIVQATTASFDGVGSNGFRSSAATIVGLNSTGRGGSVRVTVDTLSVTNGASLAASTFGQGNAGDVIVQANRATFDGVGSNGFSSWAASIVNSGATGNGGSVRITTDTLSLTNGAQLAASTFGQGNAGDVIIDAATVTFAGVGSNGFPSGAFSTVEQPGVGNGGSVRVTADTLSVTDGAQLAASTFGQGNAGDVIIDAATVTFAGVGSNGFSSTVRSVVEQPGVGNGGSVRVTADTLSVTDGAQLGASTFGQGDAGDVIIDAATATFAGVGSNGFNSGAFSTVAQPGVGDGGSVRVTADTLSVTDGAQLGASTFGQGDAGDVIIDAATATFASVSSSGFNSGAFSTVEQSAVGNGGNVRITADTLSVTDGGAVAVSSSGQGDAGNIAVIGYFIRLDQGSIQAQTTAGNGGNITLDARNLIVLRNESVISTTAGTAQQSGNGGNITINAPFIVAIPKENSDITANAFTGSGGNITITAQGIFGLQFRPTLTPLSDITASSELGVTGVVTLNSPDTSSLQNSLTEFSQTLIDPGQLLSTSCIVRRDHRQGSRFVITGSGGLPQRPSDAPLSAFPTGTIRSAPSSEEPSRSPTPRSWKPGDLIVEPQGVYQIPDGRLVLSRECDH